MTCHLLEADFPGISMQQTSFRHLRLLGGIWIGYVVGAICGSVLELHLALFALLLLIDVFRPFEA